MIGMYKITSPSTKVYIGQSVDVKKRFKQYRVLDCELQKKLHGSFIEYGVESHVFEIVCECLKSELNDKERYYQDLYNVIENGLNCVLTKGLGKRGRASNETRNNMRGSVSASKADERRDCVKKIILDTCTGIYYKGVKDAAFAYGLSVSTLTSRLSGIMINNTNLMYV